MIAFHSGIRAGLVAALALASAAGWSEALVVPASIDPLIRSAPTTSKGAPLLLSVTLAGNRLVAVGERGMILSSDDNGSTWKQAKVPVSVLLTGVRFATPEKGWAVGHGGIVLKTVDGGNSWSKQLDGLVAARLVLEAAKAVVASKPEDASAKRQLADAERLVNDGADKPFFDIYAESESTALIVGAYGLVFRTEDGGKTWQPWQSHMVNEKGAHLYAIRAAGNVLYVAGEQGVIFVSHDKGKSFTSIKTPYNGSLFGLSVFTEQSLVVYGLRGKSFWSTNGGSTWQESQTGMQAALNGGAVLKDGSTVVVSQAGNLLHSTDGGQSFTLQKLDNPSPFVAVTQAADGSFILVGARGVTRLPALTAQKS